MTTQEKSLIRVSQTAASLTAACAFTVLIGWMLGLPTLQSFIPGLVAMNPATAVLFLVVAVCLTLKVAGNRYMSRLTIQAVGAFVIASGLLVLLAFVFQFHAGIDRLLFTASLDSNRMAPNTAACFVLLGAALLALVSGPAGKWVSQALCIVVTGVAMVSLLGYAYGARNLYGIGSYIPMALNTALLFIASATALFSASGQGGIATILYGDRSGSAMVRWLLPTAIAMPCVLGFLRVLGQRAGWYETEFGTAMMVVATVLLLVTAIVFTALALNRTDAERLRTIDELHTAHSKLRAQSQVLQSILTSMGDGVVVADREGRVMQFNPAAERILGFSEVDVRANGWESHCTFSRSDASTPCTPEQCPLSRAISGESVADEEFFFRNNKRDHSSWISITGRPLRAPSNELVGGVIVLRDISDRKRAETALRESHQQLERRVARRTKELADANHDLSQKNQENEMFVYSVSHDLRSPLVNLQGFSKELDVLASELKTLLTDVSVPDQIRSKATSLLDGDFKQSLRFIQVAVVRLSNIIDALLRLSRVGSVEYQIRAIDMHRLITRLAESVSAELQNADTTIHVQRLSRCTGDSTAIEQLFANLIGNAIKYRDKSRPSVIEVGQVEDASGSQEALRTYFVRDTGLGIPEAHQQKIFQAFKRAHPNAAPGDGIGLAVVRRTAERHGGMVWVESHEGQGSTFFVKLPAAATADVASACDLNNGPGETKDDIRGYVNLISGRR